MLPGRLIVHLMYSIGRSDKSETNWFVSKLSANVVVPLCNAICTKIKH